MNRKPQIGVSTLVFAMTGAAGLQGPQNMQQIAESLGLGLQVVIHGGWNYATMQDLRPGAVISTERLLITNKVLRPFFDQADVLDASYETARGFFPSSINIGYELGQGTYVHAVSEVCNGWWGQMLNLYQKGAVSGIVMDTCHTLSPRNGMYPVANNPRDFAAQCTALMQRDIPWVLHLQPSRIPQGANLFVVSNPWEVVSFISGAKNNPLGEMLSPLKGVTTVPIIIELDPKAGITGIFPGAHNLSRWWVKKIVLGMKNAILRDIS